MSPIGIVCAGTVLAVFSLHMTFCQETVTYDELQHAKCGCKFKMCLDKNYEGELPLDDMVQIIKGLDKIKSTCEPEMLQTSPAQYEESMNLRVKRLEKVANDLEKTVKQMLNQQVSQVEYLSSLELKMSQMQSEYDTAATHRHGNLQQIKQLVNKTEENAYRMDVLAYHEAMIQNKLKTVEADVQRQRALLEKHQEQLLQLDTGIHVRMEELNGRVQSAMTRHTALQQEVRTMRHRDVQQLVSNIQELTAMVDGLLSQQEQQARIQAKRLAFHHQQMLKMADDTCSAYPIIMPPVIMHGKSEILSTVFHDRQREYAEFKCDPGFMMEGEQRFMYCVKKQWIGDVPLCTTK